MDKKRFLKNIGFLLASSILALPILALAFETKFPVIPGVPSPSDLLSFINYLYYFLLIVGSMVSLLSLIYGGIIYFFSGGNPGKTIFAKQQIFASFTGLGILLLSFVILNFLNPNLTITKLPNLPIISGPGLAPIIPPEQRVMSYWELPIGELETDVLNKTAVLIQPIDLSKPVEDLVKELENESIYLKTLLESCECSNLFSDCDDAQCNNQLECKKESWGGTPDKIDLCPNLTIIENQQEKIEIVQNNLKLARKSLLTASISAKIAIIKLITARNLLKACLPSPMDLNTFLGIQDVQGIEKKILFDNTSLKKHPLTFYCDLNEDFVLASMNYLGTKIQELLARISFEPGGCAGDCPEGTDDCAFSNLRNYFPTEQAAREASIICQGESSSIPEGNDNLGCFNVNLSERTADYSIGLFQINLLAHCPQAITYTLNPITCAIINQQKLNQCVEYYHIPENNIEKAVALYNESLSINGSGWYPWLNTASRCELMSGLPECEEDNPPPPIGFFNLPMNSGCVYCPWNGYRYEGEGGNCHEGTDYTAIEGTSIYSVAPGTIKGWGYSVGYGYWVAIEHTPPNSSVVTSLYAHMMGPASSQVQSIGIGGYIERGIFIGREGSTGNSTGPHLHLALLKSLDINGQEPLPHFADSINPEAEGYLPLADQCVTSYCSGCY